MFFADLLGVVRAMKELFSVLRLAVYVLALPLTITAAASAHQWMNASARGAVTASEAAHVVRLTESGMLRGVVNTYATSGKVSVGNSVVSLLQGSQVVARVNSGVDGAFSFSEIQPGVYTFVSASKDAIASFGIEVVAAGSPEGVSALRAFAAPRTSVVEGFASAAGKDSAANAANAADGVKVLRATESVDLVDGMFQGTISSLNGQLAGNTVALIRGNQVVAEATTDADGAFAIADVEPGFYSVVARGSGGFATLAVQINDPTSVAPAETIYTSLVVRQEGFSVTMSDSPVEYEIVEEIISVEVIEEDPLAVDAIPGYGYGAGGGFGGGGMGGGGFGLGGIGELIGLGIGAWVLTEVIDRIDSNDRIPRPVPVPNPPPPISGYNWIYL
jgi:hypothetical protein